MVLVIAGGSHSTCHVYFLPASTCPSFPQLSLPRPGWSAWQPLHHRPPRRLVAPWHGRCAPGADAAGGGAAARRWLCELLRGATFRGLKDGSMWGFPQFGGTPISGWVISENPINVDDIRGSLISGNLHVVPCGYPSFWWDRHLKTAENGIRKAKLFADSFWHWFRKRLGLVLFRTPTL